MNTVIGKTAVILALSGILALPLYAAEQESPAKKVIKEENEKKGKDKTEKPTIFKPSEELSEDYSVPFPTDI